MSPSNCHASIPMQETPSRKPPYHSCTIEASHVFQLPKIPCESTAIKFIGTMKRKEEPSEYQPQSKYCEDDRCVVTANTRKRSGRKFVADESQASTCRFLFKSEDRWYKVDHASWHRCYHWQLINQPQHQSLNYLMQPIPIRLIALRDRPLSSK